VRFMKGLGTLGLAVLMALAPALGASATVEFGNNPQRTHQSGVTANGTWDGYNVIESARYRGQTVLLGGSNATAMGYGGSLYFPVSAPDDSPSGQGYLVDFNLDHWHDGNPSVSWVVPITGVSNSSPLILDNGNVYLAAGPTLYGFYSSGQSLRFFPDNLHSNTPIYRNQEVSYPLYAGGLIWVSSQNGYLYAVNPNTLKDVYSIYVESRLDGSPTLVQGENGTYYIAVGTAYAPGNKNGTGTLFLYTLQGKLADSAYSGVNRPPIPEKIVHRFR
jgi:outer membrane protein assembly factor BamB